MYLGPEASKARAREAAAARANRLEIVKALSIGQIDRRDLFRWGIFTATGALACVNGLSPYATSAYAQVPTGTPRSPLFGAKKFTTAMYRALPQNPIPLVATGAGHALWATDDGDPEPPAMRLSYHELYNQSRGAAWVNPMTGRGPIEGRPPGEFFAHQRWAEFFPKVGYLMSLGQIQESGHYADGWPDQEENAVWSFGPRKPGARCELRGSRTGYGYPCLIKARYGEPILNRIYNDLPNDRTANGGFGRNEISTHLHNAHNGAESDGACNAYHFPGTFYDYLWSNTLARRDRPDLWLRSDPNHLLKASGPDDGDGLVPVAGDFREIQSSLWFHDHRFFFTAENVHKGNFAVYNLYSGPDRGREDLNDGINLRLPSGSLLPWGNTDFDVNVAISNPAFDPDGQLFFDIFDTEGFLGDMLCVNGQYAPYFEVLPRRYRFRILNASMARFVKLALAVNRSSKFARQTPVPFHVIGNDGNLLVRPVATTQTDEMGVAERFDIVVDFSTFKPGDSLYLLNLLEQVDGRKPKRAVTLASAFGNLATDPCVGPFLEFRVVDEVRSVDDRSKTYKLDDGIQDLSVDFNHPDWTSGRNTLTQQVPVVAPVRERVFTFGRSGGGDSRSKTTGQCTPDCPETATFPWSIKVNGQAAHTFNANRISALIPRPGEVEHWTLVNDGTGWDHPVHLHFEEGVTIDRGGAAMAPTELLARKDVWRLRPGGRVKFQVRFGEFGGSYVAHCHNTTHEDFAMLMRMQLQTPAPNDPAYRGQPQYVPTMTPLPTPDGVVWKYPEILPEADPTKRQFTATLQAALK
ncbi:multicopper oxidase domain-containing protein [Methylopila sp. Yamaguchi]|uniref:multicopper oxidase domain-containing protein n=1 Tax=Methylopila sp. Yamaguchi TaxID=1437817 RepID=UPI000CB27EBB|nr:multicopper oxidase domain-containing protein [Methylopila sp. Yamaguchi]GBD48044.1 bilirubin oxidase [Methylopila sp. Yamaguchi]